ncbi:MBL fold metallo-hydrolase [Candidatus Micrarchaeota archaeon]|nr:MBL fold metallo-hydrolase [Candidatus Micrarchaeota archaeon]
MDITRFSQSCFFIRTSGMMMLINPGRDCFTETSKNVLDYGKFLSQFPNVNACVVTSEHDDNYDLGFLKKLYEDCRTPFFFSTESVLRDTENELLFGMSDSLKEGERIRLGENVSLEGAGVSKESFGFLLDDGKTSIYYCGGPQLTEGTSADVVFIPVGGSFTIGRAAAFINTAKPKIVVLMYHDPSDSFGLGEFAREMGASETKVAVLKPGERLKV